MVIVSVWVEPFSFTYFQNTSNESTVGVSEIPNIGSEIRLSHSSNATIYYHDENGEYIYEKQLDNNSNVM